MMGMLPRVMLLTTYLTASVASAHDLGCDGRPPPAHIKAACCGIADAHQIDPADVSQDDHGNWHVRIGTVERVIPDEKSEPSPDGCYWLFWSDTIPKGMMSENVNLYCWLVPLDL